MLELIVTYLIVCFGRLEVVAPSRFCLLVIYIYIYRVYCCICTRPYNPRNEYIYIYTTGRYETNNQPISLLICFTSCYVEFNIQWNILIFVNFPSLVILHIREFFDLWIPDFQNTSSYDACVFFNNSAPVNWNKTLHFVGS